ncbi:MAG: hypothetical protein AB1538_01590 [Bacillota bacterium]
MFDDVFQFPDIAREVMVEQNVLGPFCKPDNGFSLQGVETVDEVFDQ